MMERKPPRKPARTKLQTFSSASSSPAASTNAQHEEVELDDELYEANASQSQQATSQSARERKQNTRYDSAIYQVGSDQEVEPQDQDEEEELQDHEQHLEDDSEVDSNKDDNEENDESQDEHEDAEESKMRKRGGKRRRMLKEEVDGSNTVADTQKQRKRGRPRKASRKMGTQKNTQKRSVGRPRTRPKTRAPHKPLLFEEEEEEAGEDEIFVDPVDDGNDADKEEEIEVERPSTPHPSYDYLEPIIRLDDTLHDDIVANELTEVLGAYDYLNTALPARGLDPNKYLHVWKHCLEPLVQNLFEQAATPFYQLTKKKLTQDMVMTELLSMQLAGVYHTGVGHLREDVNHNHQLPAYLQFPHNSESDSRNFWLVLGVMEGTARKPDPAVVVKLQPNPREPYATPPSIAAIAEAVTSIPRKVLLFIRKRLPKKVHLLLGIDDYAAACSGEGLRSIGFVVRFIQAKRVRMGTPYHIIGTQLLRLALSITLALKDDRREGVTLVENVSKNFSSITDIGAFGKPNSQNGIHLDGDREYRGVLKRLREDFEIDYTCTIFGGSDRNHQCGFGKPGSRSAGIIRSISEVGPQVALFCKPRDRPDCVQMVYRQSSSSVAGNSEGRLVFLESTLPLENKWVAKSDGRPLARPLQNSPNEIGDKDPFAACVYEAHQAYRSSRIRLLVESPRSPLWKFSRLWRISSTQGVEVSMVCKAEMLRFMLVGEQGGTFLNIPVEINDNSTRVRIEASQDAPGFKLIMSSATLLRLRKHGAFLYQISHAEELHLLKKLQAVAGEKIDGASEHDLLEAAKQLKVDITNVKGNETKLEALRKAVREARESFGMDESVIMRLLPSYGKNFQTSREMDAGLYLEESARKDIVLQCQKKLELNNDAGFRVFVVGRDDVGLEQHPDHDRVVTTSDGSITIIRAEKPQEEEEQAKVPQFSLDWGVTQVTSEGDLSAENAPLPVKWREVVIALHGELESLRQKGKHELNEEELERLGLLKQWAKESDWWFSIYHLEMEIKTKSSRKSVSEIREFVKQTTSAKKRLENGILRLNVSYQISAEEKRLLWQASEGSVGYVIQCLHHAATAESFGTLFAQVDASNRDVLALTMLIYDQEVRQNHLEFMNVAALILNASVEHDPDLAKNTGVPLDEIICNKSISDAIVSRAEVEPFLGKFEVNKPAMIELKNVCKSTSDHLKKDTKKVLMPAQGLSPIQQFASEMTAIGTINATRLYRAFKFAPRLFDGEIPDGPIFPQLGITHGRILVGLENVGTTSAFVLDACRTYMVEQASSNTPNSSLPRHVVDAARRLQSEAASRVAFGDFDPENPACFEMVDKLLRALPFENRKSHFESNPVLKGLRLSGQSAVEHVAAAQESKRSCGLACVNCDGHGNCAGWKANTTIYKCSMCDVFLSIEPREYWMGRSAFDVWHQFRELPSHPYSGGQVDPFPRLGDEGGKITASAKKRRTASNFEEIAKQVHTEMDATRRQLFPSSTNQPVTPQT